MEPGERACRPCVERGLAAPEPGGRLPIPRRNLDGATALEQIDRQFGDRELAELRTRERYASCDQVTGPDSALQWLAENVVITHEYGR
jgi:hypothetical protein